MDSSFEEGLEKLRKYIETYSVETVHRLLAAFLIWLFGVLVFIPLASNLNWQTRVFCSLILFAAFTLLLLRGLPNLKKLIDAFSILPARKYSLEKGLDYEKSLLMFRQAFYIISAIVLYLLYLPFLANFHPSLSGIVLILLLIWIFFLSLGTLTILWQEIIGWLRA
ncbi:hypothetical protein GWN63_02665 [Candidatus Bathyarchaeota archaeon]|nr:hypothetical protein [Candidatus Bathyarchaeota archaeon]NIW16398.1 hypothetical protein [Candidatus Bathyarchaeota archaeon]NIW34371.1 hypothetical protein [Candidatus Bathyarchaeota archaeon]